MNYTSEERPVIQVNTLGGFSLTLGEKNMGAVSYTHLYNCFHQRILIFREYIFYYHTTQPCSIKGENATDITFTTDVKI